MSEPVELRLYSPLQIDIIDRDISDRAIPLQAVSREQKEEYLRRIVRALGELQSQEDARHAFTAPQQDWSEISKNIISVVRAVTLVSNRPYGLYLCRSKRELAPKEVENLKCYCRDQWEHGWGEGYAHCPREGVSLGLYIHFWQDTAAPLLLRRELEAIRSAERGTAVITEITPDTFWMLMAQARNICGKDQNAAAYWLTERLLEMGPEQAVNFHSIMHGYMELADKYGLWNAADEGFEDGGRDRHDHYNRSRYYALNLHSVFYRGTVEWRCFNSTLHAGKVAAYVNLCLAISAQAIAQRSTVMRKTHSDNELFTFRVWLVRLGLNGEEFKHTRDHLLEHLDGDRSWRHDKDSYACNQKKKKQEMER